MVIITGKGEGGRIFIGLDKSFKDNGVFSREFYKEEGDWIIKDGDKKVIGLVCHPETWIKYIKKMAPEKLPEIKEVLEIIEKEDFI